MTAVWIVIGAVVLIALIGVLIRSSLVSSRNRVEEAWSGADMQLKRRHALVPNLVESVSGSARTRARRADASPRRVPMRCAPPGRARRATPRAP
jgi:hypothetical protein